jgi:hypothetical protein
LYFRHSDRDHRQHDIPGQAPQDCAKQRNLTDRGRDHARRGYFVRMIATYPELDNIDAIIVSVVPFPAVGGAQPR